MRTVLAGAVLVIAAANILVRQELNHGVCPGATVPASCMVIFFPEGGPRV
jgi:hypothetical protein